MLLFYEKYFPPKTPPHIHFGFRFYENKRQKGRDESAIGIHKLPYQIMKGDSNSALPNVHITGPIRAQLLQSRLQKQMLLLLTDLYYQDSAIPKQLYHPRAQTIKTKLLAKRVYCLHYM